MTYSVEGGLFAGAYTQDSAWGVLAELGLGAAVARGRHELEAGVDFERDPFARRAFNFTDDDTIVSPTRLVQRVDSLGLGVDWSAAWAEDVDTRASMHVGQRWTEIPEDQRRSFAVDGGVRKGASWNERGTWVDAEVGAFAMTYPRYDAGGRSLDQRGGQMSAEVGWSWGRVAEVALSWNGQVTAYRHARYDALDADGDVVQADASKRYVRHDVDVELVARPGAHARLSVAPGLRIHDSSNYDREVAGRTESGAADDRLFRDYYDYDRVGVDVGASWRPRTLARFGVRVGWWRRVFDTYEARDVDNVWTGELRTDQSVEVAVDASWPLWRSDEVSLSAAAFGSHLVRTSNMKRERSFATNYDITRAFVGVRFEH